MPGRASAGSASPFHPGDMGAKLREIAIPVIGCLEHRDCLVAVILFFPFRISVFPFPCLVTELSTKPPTHGMLLYLRPESASKYRGGATLTDVGEDYEAISKNSRLFNSS